MTDHLIGTNRPLWQSLHTDVWKILLAGLVALILAVWLCFGADGYTALQLAIVAFFGAAFAATPFVLWRLSKKPASDARVSFKEWAAGDLDTLNGRMPAREAAIIVLVAPAAGVVGLAAVSFIAYLAAVGAL